MDRSIQRRRYPTSVRALLRCLALPDQRKCWLIENGRNYGVVADRGTFRSSPHDWKFVRSVRRDTVSVALADELLLLGEEDVVPEYELGRGVWRWEEGLLGRPAVLTRAGWGAW